jgi:hypothetical protein
MPAQLKDRFYVVTNATLGNPRAPLHIDGQHAEKPTYTIKSLCGMRTQMVIPTDEQILKSPLCSECQWALVRAESRVIR